MFVTLCVMVGFTAQSLHSCSLLLSHIPSSSCSTARSDPTGLLMGPSDMQLSYPLVPLMIGTCIPSTGLSFLVRGGNKQVLKLESKQKEWYHSCQTLLPKFVSEEFSRLLYCHGRTATFQDSKRWCSWWTVSCLFGVIFICNKSMVNCTVAVEEQPHRHFPF